MILKRVLMPLFVLGIIFGLSSVAHAQVTCAATSIPASRATATGHTEPTGDVTVTCTSSAAGTIATASILQIDYGVTITNNTSVPVGKVIAVAGCTGVYVCGGNVTLGAGGGVTSNLAGTIQVNVPGTTAFGGAGVVGTFTVTNVLTSLAGTGKSSTSATISVATPGNGYLINGAADTTTTISTVLAGIKDPVLTAAPVGSAVVFANGTSFDTTWGIDITENYVDMFRESAQFNGGVTLPQSSGADTQLKLTFAGIPAGAFLSGCGATAVKADGTVSALAPSVSSTTVDITNPTITINFEGPADLSQVETVQFKCTGFSVGTATTPFAGSGITVQVTLAPTGAALPGPLGSVSSSPSIGQIPRYAANQQPTTALTVVTIVPATTTMLTPFATAGGGFDTGLAVSNTTGDPFGSANGGAIAQNGTITFTFFPNGGTSFAFTTGAAGTPTGNGGLTSGVLNAGNTYSVLVSELLKAAGKGPAFSGYIFVTTNFTNGHGVSFVVSNFDGKFTSYSPMLVLVPPAAISRQGVVESAGQ